MCERAGRLTAKTGGFRPAGQVTLWDLDWPAERRVVLPAAARAALLEQLGRDLAVLEAANVMDYSLLLGTPDTPEASLGCCHFG